VSCFFSSRRRHTRLVSDWSSDVCSSDLPAGPQQRKRPPIGMLQTLKLPLTKRAATVPFKRAQAEPGSGPLFHQRAMALDERAPASEPPVIRNELRMRQGVAVQENQVFAPRPGDSLVENSRAAEALVGLPDVLG